MERDNYRHSSESLVRKITEERDRFVSAWQHGADSTELNHIRENIQQLNDLLWNVSGEEDRFGNSQRGFQRSDRDFATRSGPTI
jgi:hypothetical protein